MLALSSYFWIEGLRTHLSKWSVSNSTYCILNFRSWPQRVFFWDPELWALLSGLSQHCRCLVIFTNVWRGNSDRWHYPPFLDQFVGTRKPPQEISAILIECSSCCWARLSWTQQRRFCIGPEPQQSEPLWGRRDRANGSYDCITKACAVVRPSYRWYIDQAETE